MQETHYARPLTASKRTASCRRKTGALASSGHRRAGCQTQTSYDRSHVTRWEIKRTLYGQHLVLNFIQRERPQCVFGNKGKRKGVAVHATKAYRRRRGKASLILYGAAWRR